ncbi:MAG: AraC family transcriptional regulator [Eubacteriales bacterium]|nr:AraC family transcriptional regulator [Eubacteriales bacterium]
MLHEWFDKITSVVKMQISSENPFGCGTYLQGDGQVVSGFAWYYQYNSILAILKCDFIFTRSTRLKIDAEAKYFSLRLDYARHLPPGKVVAFVENNRISLDTEIKKGTRFAYTEVIYSPTLYNKHFSNAFSTAFADPVEIIQSMGENHSWSAKITKILVEISQSMLSNSAAELFYIGKSCELMSALIEMGTVRLPHKSSDYQEIQRVLHYIDHNYRGDIKQADLVSLVNMSPSKLKTLFKTFTNSTITDYILDKKADHAVHLLTETDMPIAQIASSLGFLLPLRKESASLLLLIEIRSSSAAPIMQLISKTCAVWKTFN